MVWSPRLIRYQDSAGAVSVVLGHPLLDDYLEFVAARLRTNTLLATAYDLKVFFAVVAKAPAEVTTSDVLAFITAQRQPRHDDNVVRLADGQAGLSARTIKRRLSSVSGRADRRPLGLPQRRPKTLPRNAVTGRAFLGQATDACRVHYDLVRRVPGSAYMWAVPPLILTSGLSNYTISGVTARSAATDRFCCARERPFP